MELNCLDVDDDDKDGDDNDHAIFWLGIGGKDKKILHSLLLAVQSNDNLCCKYHLQFMTFLMKFT